MSVKLEEVGTGTFVFRGDRGQIVKVNGQKHFKKCR
jgi:hypothetical protein